MYFPLVAPFCFYRSAFQTLQRPNTSVVSHPIFSVRHRLHHIEWLVSSSFSQRFRCHFVKLPQVYWLIQHVLRNVIVNLCTYRYGVQEVEPGSLFIFFSPGFPVGFRQRTFRWKSTHLTHLTLRVGSMTSCPNCLRTLSGGQLWTPLSMWCATSY